MAPGVRSMKCACPLTCMQVARHAAAPRCHAAIKRKPAPEPPASPTDVHAAGQALVQQQPGVTAAAALDETGAGAAVGRPKRVRAAPKWLESGVDVHALAALLKPVSD